MSKKKKEKKLGIGDFVIHRFLSNSPVMRITDVEEDEDSEDNDIYCICQWFTINQEYLTAYFNRKDLLDAAMVTA